ncbi:hypothetical protein [Streptomyces sp. NPDC059460]|uniref:hypothetical protein n=1 Tax=Streptomyces sp. NPDC059460 TaxID=3346840 RepID=UPI003674862F
MRSKVCHGALRAVDCSAAREVPGVVGAWSAADLTDVPPVRPLGSCLAGPASPSLSK